MPPNEETAPAAGRITFVDNQVDQTTGTIRIKATFPNSNRQPLAGAVRQRASTARHPIRARSSCRRSPCRRVPKGSYVYVVKGDQTVEMRPVDRRAHRGMRNGSQGGRQARRNGRHRRPAAPRAGQPHQRSRAEPPRRRTHEPLSAVHQASNHDDAHHARHRRLRRDVVSPAAGRRPSGNRLPDDLGQRLAARRQSRDDGVGRRAAARKAVLDDFRPHVDELDQHAGHHEHHAAVRPQPRHRCRRAGRPDDDRAGRHGSFRRRCRRRRRTSR